MLQAVLDGAPRGRARARARVLRRRAVAGELADAGLSRRGAPRGRLRQVHRWLRDGACGSRGSSAARRPDLILNWAAKTQLYGSPAAMLAGMSDRVVWWQQSIPTEPGSIARHAAAGRRDRLLLHGGGRGPGPAVPAPAGLRRRRRDRRAQRQPGGRRPSRGRRPARRSPAHCSRQWCPWSAWSDGCSRGRARTGCCARRRCCASGAASPHADRRRRRLRALRRVRRVAAGAGRRSGPRPTPSP